MEIVPTRRKNKESLDSLLDKKAELKLQIEYQKRIISDRSQQIMTPGFMLGYIFTTIQKKTNLSDVIKSGFRLGKKIVDFFKKPTHQV